MLVSREELIPGQKAPQPEGAPVRENEFGSQVMEPDNCETSNNMVTQLRKLRRPPTAQHLKREDPAVERAELATHASICARSR